MLESVVALATLLRHYTFEVGEGYVFAPVFTGFGLRPFDASRGEVSMRLKVLPRPGVPAPEAVA